MSKAITEFGDLFKAKCLSFNVFLLSVECFPLFFRLLIDFYSKNVFKMFSKCSKNVNGYEKGSVVMVADWGVKIRRNQWCQFSIGFCHFPAGVSLRFLLWYSLKEGDNTCSGLFARTAWVGIDALGAVNTSRYRRSSASLPASHRLVYVSLPDIAGSFHQAHTNVSLRLAPLTCSKHQETDP